MPIRDIVSIPNPILRAPCQPVEEYSDDIQLLLNDMYDSMLANRGLGLAAPQIGISKQIAIIDLSSDYIPQPNFLTHSAQQAADHIFKGRLELINPRITSAETKVSSEEGCLSIPDYRDTVPRFNLVKVDAFDRLGRKFSFSATELLSFAVQHELDHLAGVLFIDHLSRLKKSFFRKWAVKKLGTSDV